MSHSLNISVVLCPHWKNFCFTDEEVSIVADELEKIGRKQSSVDYRLIKDLLNLWKIHSWLKVYQLSDSVLTQLLLSVNTINECRFVKKAIEEVVSAREEFRDSLSPEVLQVALLKNHIRSELEKEYGNLDLFNEVMMKKMLKSSEDITNLESIIDGFFVPRFKTSDLRLGSGSILRSYVRVDRII